MISAPASVKFEQSRSISIDVAASDAVDGVVTVEFDCPAVLALNDTTLSGSIPGDYSCVLTATDRAGNQAIVQLGVTVEASVGVPLRKDADINNDGIADQADIDILVSCLTQMPVDASAPCAESDLNGDGVVDVLDRDALEARQQSTFPTPVEAAALFTPGIVANGFTPDAVAIDDVTSDGIPDVVTSGETAGATFLSVGAGDGTFMAQRNVIPTGATDLALADTNADGHLDIVSLDTNAQTVSVFPGNGDGTFDATTAPFTAGQDPREMKVGDFDGDGAPDIVVANAGSNDLSVFHGDQTGRYDSELRLPVNNLPRFLHVADFTSDSLSDVVVIYFPTSNGVEEVAVFLGRGDGTFDSLAPFDIGVNAGVRSLHVLDTDQDGNADLLFGLANLGPVYPIGDSAGALFGQGDGTFSGSLQIPGSQLAPLSIAAGDFNGDGVRDMAAWGTQYSYSGIVASVSLGDGSGDFRHDLYASPGKLHAADLNVDGAADIVVQGSLSVNAMLVNEEGVFDAPVYIASSGPDGSVVAYDIRLVDVDGDGDVDVMWSFADGAGCTSCLGWNRGVLRLDADGSLVNLVTLSGYLHAHFEPIDIDNDGLVEMVFPADSSGNCLQAVVGLAEGANDVGTIACSVAFTDASEIAAADLNADGLTDIIANGYPARLGVALGEGGGVFSEALAFELEGLALDIESADFNRDGHADVMFRLDERPGEALIMNGDGTGYLGAPESVSLNLPTANSLTVADVNGDGRSDILSMGTNGDVSVLLGAVTDPFSTPFVFSLGASVSAANGSFQLDDLNRDGILDLVFSNAGRGQVGVSLGNGDGGFQPPTYFPYRYSQIRLGDLNDDGKLDIASPTSIIAILYQR